MEKRITELVRDDETLVKNWGYSGHTRPRGRQTLRQVASAAGINRNRAVTLPKLKFLENQ